MSVQLPFASCCSILMKPPIKPTTLATGPLDRTAFVIVAPALVAGTPLQFVNCVAAASLPAQDPSAVAAAPLFSVPLLQNVLGANRPVSPFVTLIVVVLASQAAVSVVVTF